jgi:hypothetical protein
LLDPKAMRHDSNSLAAALRAARLAARRPPTSDDAPPPSVLPLTPAARAALVPHPDQLSIE